MINLKKFRRLIVVFCATLSLISCTSVAKFSSGKTIEITPTIVQKPTVADIQVNEKKVTGTYTGEIKTIPLEAIKNEAVASALKTVMADVLVEPHFETTINGRLTTVMVSGFPATFTNFRTMKNEDIPLMQLGAVKQVNTFVPPTVKTKKSKYGKTALITLGALVATALTLTIVSSSM